MQPAKQQRGISGLGLLAALGVGLGFGSGLPSENAAPRLTSAQRARRRPVSKAARGYATRYMHVLTPFVTERNLAALANVRKARAK